MFKLFFILIAITTMISMGVVGKMGSYSPARVKPAPMTVSLSGAIAFPGRIPGPDTVFKLRRAVQMEDVETLNALLVENHLFLAPSE
ncbi:MAG: hypothetical protein QM496_18645 [Verrucomicrobiota bacterium]